MSREVQTRLHAHLQTAGASDALLFLDTNTIQGGALIRIADQVGAINLRRPGLPALRLLIPALVFAERNAQERRERQQKGIPFDPHKVRAFLASKQITVLPFDIEAADNASQVLARWAPGKDDLRLRRWRQLCQILHSAAADQMPGDLLKTLQQLPNPPRLSGTIDWLIAAQATAQNLWLITNDTGMEFEQAPLLTSAELTSLLSNLFLSI